MNKTRIGICFILLLFTVISVQAQNSVWGMEWNIDNTGDDPGEKLVAIIDVGDLGTYDGVELMGIVIDNNGNWGYALPTVANFRLFVKFSQGFDCALEQSVKTTRIKLGLRKISETKVHLVAYCPYHHSGMRIILKKVEGFASVMLGSGENSSTGDLIIPEPTYKNIFSGKMGINTNSPSCELDVVGKIKATEIKIEAQTADFVFEDDYKLRPLDEVEAFVKENKHLPEIPSAKQMEADGVNVAEMNKLLLQKVEELTLYIIEMKKEIVQLKNENSKPKK